VTKIEILSPEGVERHTDDQLAPRPQRLDGVTVALHSNSKPGALGLLEAVGEALQVRGAQLRRWSKAHSARPSQHVAEMSVAARAAVFALGD
jgi:hypothetical protein